MTPAEIAGLLTAFAAIIGALGAIYGQVRATHQAVNSRMDRLLELTASASHAEGVLAGGPPESTERPVSAPPDRLSDEKGL